MKKLFTNEIYIQPNFLPSELCEKWASKIFENLDVFGPDVQPEYGQMSAFYGMLEAGLNESYFRYARKHNHFLVKNFPEIKNIIKRVGEIILTKSGIPREVIPVEPRDKQYFLIAGFNIQLHDWLIYNIHTDTEGLVMYPSSIFEKKTRAYSCVISIKRSAQFINNRGGELDIWKERYLANELEKFYRPDGVRAHSLDSRIKVDYSPGTMVLFDSFMPHVVRPFRVQKKEDRRISLVMHFNYRDRTEKNPFPHLEYWY